MPSESPSSDLPSDSSSQRPQAPLPTTPFPSQVTFWYRVIDWPEDAAERITLDSTADVSALHKAIAPNVLDPFRPDQPVHATNIEIWQVCGCGRRRVKQILTHLT